MRGKSSTICHLRRLTSQKGAHRSAVLVFLGNKSLTRVSRHERAIPLAPYARQLESFMLEHNGRFNSRDYDKFERMELTESPVRDAIRELKTYSLETLAQRFDVRLFGRGKRVFARLDAMVLLFPRIHSTRAK